MTLTKGRITYRRFVNTGQVLPGRLVWPLSATITTPAVPRITNLLSGGVCLLANFFLS